MNNNLIYYLTNSSGSLSTQELLINFLAALIAGAIIVSVKPPHGLNRRTAA